MVRADLEAELAVAKRVYAYIRDYRETHSYAPDAHQVWLKLNISKKEYYAALRWLEARRFLSRPEWGKSWRFARVNVRLCACGTELTLANATCEINSRGYLIIRRDCRTCITRRQVEKQREWRARNPGYYTAVHRRVRQQQRSDHEKGASA